MTTSLNTDSAAMPPGTKAAFRCGLAALLTCWTVIGGLVMGMLALGFSMRALNEIDAADGQLPGRGKARAGAIMGGLAMILSLLLPMAALLTVLLMNPPPRQSPRSQLPNNAQLRGIHQAIVTYAQINNGYYPGLNAQGDVVDVSVEERFRILLEANFFTGEYAISPASGEHKMPWMGGDVTSDNYSYAMLQIPDAGGRRDEWRETLNTYAAVMTDRNIGTTTAPQSIHSRHGDWRGGVVWNDNRVMFESHHLMDETQYGGQTNPINRYDHLFEAQGDHDAWMVYEGNR